MGDQIDTRGADIGGPRTPGEPVPKGTPLLDNGQGGNLLVPWDDLMYAGSGFDSVSRKNFASALTNTGANLKPYPAAGNIAQYVQKKILQVQSAESMREVLQFGTKLAFGYDAFSANGVGKFLKESQVDRYNLYFMVICYVQNTVIRLDDNQLKLKAGPMSMEADEFRATYGDYFVAGWIKGGYLIGLAQVTAESKQVLDKVKTELNAGYGGKGIDFSSTFAAAWENLSKSHQVESRLEVIYAGMNGETVRQYALGQPGAINPPPIRGGGGDDDDDKISDEKIQAIFEDDEDDEDDREYLSVEESKEYFKAMAGLPMKFGKTGGNTGSNHGNGGGPGKPEFEHLQPGLLPQPVVDYQTVRMNMDGLLKAADLLPQQVLTNGVPLQAVLQPYSTLGKKTKKADISVLDVTLKREKLSDCYTTASYISKSMAYALKNRSQVARSAHDLKQIQEQMQTLMNACVAAWRRLDDDYTFVLAPEIQLPDLKLIPGWAIEKTKFSLFGEVLDTSPPTINPALFVTILGEAVDRALDKADVTLTQEARTALKGYLDEVRKSCDQNYKNAGKFLRRISALFRTLDSKPAERSQRLDDMAREAARHLRVLETKGQELERTFGSLENKGGLDAAKLTSLLKDVNAVVFGLDGVKYGFRKFWKTVEKNLGDLAQASRSWADDDRFNDLIDYRRDQSYSDLGNDFDEQQAVLTNGEVYRMLK